MTKITKAVIPVAGFGTRFLPASKSQPKEMLPIVDKPTIQFIVEALVEAGITQIIIVTSGNKRAVEDHFDRSPELEKWLEKAKKTDLLKELRAIPRLANFIYIRQKGPVGNGTPVLNAKSLIGNEPFIVCYGDEFYTGKPNWIKQMISVYQKYQDPVVALVKVTKEDTKRYGIFSGPEVERNIYQINSIMEKPGPQKAKSNLGGIGGYVLTPDIFNILEKLKPGKGGEVWLADAVKQLNRIRPIYGRLIEGKLYDAGTILGWLKANIELGLSHPKIHNEFKQYLKKLKIQ
ncbi:TPA: UTP--glucose-1-phosphate uridylyltransferase [Candidatus Komeilibacteria bacterium]|nr:MAG: Nucleotidyl transferase [Parcubacteria group bacterium GW2011_GWF2_45_11]OGY92654.1 MAG: UTP--glucose-1-phosphate uridylyltransferase [Candidatus Komeilibacteria bacterium RIFOXYA2_FULL_45_9]HAH04752.1 UTP--glucose-1-phosphate uridylyltransferase [Candidatus Komeilibacteria bacterium]HCC73874.1 UTP--glucose-1-phosphate uridylyltransferase [Candidatus Komeilibacteria bacterium]